MGEKVWVGVCKRSREEPSVELEEGGGAIVGKDKGDFAEGAKLFVYDSPEVGWVVRFVFEVKRVVLEKPINPG